MYGGFKPSKAADEVHTLEERLTQNQRTSPHELFIEERLSMFKTEAEQTYSIAPFLAENRGIDSTRRNYVIEPGGRARYSIVSPCRPEFDGVVTRNEAFGHNQQPDDKTRV
jgi:hypothetical protein